MKLSQFLMVLFVMVVVVVFLQKPPATMQLGQMKVGQILVGGGDICFYLSAGTYESEHPFGALGSCSLPVQVGQTVYFRIGPVPKKLINLDLNGAPFVISGADASEFKAEGLKFQLVE